MSNAIQKQSEEVLTACDTIALKYAYAGLTYEARGARAWLAGDESGARKNWDLATRKFSLARSSTTPERFENVLRAAKATRATVCA